MRKRTLGIVLALLLLSSQAIGKDYPQAYCDTPPNIKNTLYHSGFIKFSYAMTDQGYLITIYIGDGRYVITGEDQKTACVLAEGKNFYTMEGFDI